MSSFLAGIHWLRVLVVSFLGFFLGGLWYSPLLFAKPWIKEMKFTPEELSQKGGAAPLLIRAYLFTVISTLSTDYFVTTHHAHSFLSGAKVGLLLGLGIVAAREAVNFGFEKRTIKLSGGAGSTPQLFEGPWALFRLFNQFEVQPSAQPEKFTVVLLVDGKKARMEVTSSSAINPLRMREISTFRCPDGL